jgi:hypothetical protein
MKSFNLSRIGGFARAALLVLGLALPACGGQADDEAQFVGSWAENGQEWITCSGMSPTSTPIMDTFTVNRGVDAPLTVILQNPSCVLNLDVDGNTATLRPGQSCSQTTSGATATLMLTTGTISLNDAKDGTMTFSGTGEASSSTRSVNCTFSSMVTLNKVGQ